MDSKNLFSGFSDDESRKEFVSPNRGPPLSRTTPQLLWYIHTGSLIFLTLQQTLQPLLVRKAHNEAEKASTPIVDSTIVLVTEIMRLSICCFHVILRNQSFNKALIEIYSVFTNNTKETFKVCVPALVYVVQNNLYFFALKHLDATVFSITYQLRILTTALLTVLILRRVFSNIQWGALVVSLIGVIFVQISSRQNSTSTTTVEEKYSDQFIGLTTVLSMCWMSGFAGVYLEGVFKNSTCDIWLQNIRLSVITLPFAFLTVGHDSELLRENGFFYGWNWLVWTIAISSAVSGIVVAVVMKYADNIKKSYCQSIALGGTALLSVASGDVRASILLFCGVSLVILSVFLYSLNPPSKVQPKNIIITVNLKAPIQTRAEFVNVNENDNY